MIALHPLILAAGKSWQKYAAQGQKNVHSTDSPCFMLLKYDLFLACAFALFWACTCT